MKKSVMAEKGPDGSTLLQGLGDEVDAQLAPASAWEGGSSKRVSSAGGANPPKANSGAAKGAKPIGAKGAKGLVEGGIDPFELLRSQHRDVDSLFQEIEHDNQSRGRKVILSEIMTKIEAHALIEEKLFYPKGAKADAKQTMECYEEHKLCRVLMRDIGKMSMTDKALMAKVKVLKDLVQHHVKEEEEEYFDKVREKYDERQLQSMGMELKVEFDRIVQRLSTGGARSRSGRRMRASAGRASTTRSSGRNVDRTANAASKKRASGKPTLAAGRARKAAGARKGGRSNDGRMPNASRSGRSNGVSPQA